MTKKITAQLWLNHQYPNKEQVETIELDNNFKFKESSRLIIDDYPELKKIKKKYVIAGKSPLELVKITISNCPQLETIDISSFENTEELILNNLPSLKELNCSHNSLTKIEFIDTGEKLKHLDLGNNDFNQDLSFITHLVNLEELDLRKNNFTGSLEYLKEMNKLKKIVISDTNLDSGLEYLPDSLEDFYCSAFYRKDAKSQNFYNLFAKEEITVETEWDDKIKEFSQKLQIWRKINSGLIIKVQKEIIEEKNEIIVQLEEDLKIEREEAAKALEKAKEWRERQLKELTTQKDQRIKELEQQLESLKLKLEEKIEIPSK